MGAMLHGMLSIAYPYPCFLRLVKSTVDLGCTTPKITVDYESSCGGGMSAFYCPKRPRFVGCCQEVL